MPDNSKLDLTYRPRRLRRTASLRALTEETVLRPANFIAPLFVVEGKGAPQPIASMPGVSRLSIGDTKAHGLNARVVSQSLCTALASG